MSLPSRRELLVGVGTAVGVAAGCLSAPDGSTPTGDATGTPAATTEPTAAPSATTDGSQNDPIGIDLRNGFDSAVRVRVTVTTDAERVSEQIAEVPAGGRKVLHPGIDDVGEYTIAVDATDGPAGETTVGIDDYDLDNGSNIIVSVGSEGVRFLIQE